MGWVNVRAYVRTLPRIQRTCSKLAIGWSREMDINAAIRKSALALGYTSLKEKQVEAMYSFLQGKDTFVSLPTGYGKSLIYAALPIAFDFLRGMSTHTVHFVIATLHCCSVFI